MSLRDLVTTSDPRLIAFQNAFIFFGFIAVCLGLAYLDLSEEETRGIASNLALIGLIGFSTLFVRSTVDTSYSINVIVGVAFGYGIWLILGDHIEEMAVQLKTEN